MNNLILCLLASSAFVMHSAYAVGNKDFAPLEQLIEKTKTQTKLQSGTAIALVQDGKVLYQGYFGYADIKARQKVQPDTVFYIASATKPFTAFATLLLEQQNKLSTNTSLQQMFADTQFRGVDVSKISIKQLLTHQSGLDNQPLVWATAYSGIHTPASLKALVAGSYPDAESKTGQFNYSNVGYNILSTWLDQQSDLSWQQQLQTLIFTPLQMQHSSTLVSEAKRKNWMLAKPYSAMSPTPAQELYLQKTDRTMHAAGGMLATAPDLAKFLIAQMQDGGAVFPETVIKKAQQTEVVTDSNYNDFNRSGYAWGWYSGDYKGERMLHHFGSFAGFHAHLSFIPEKNIGLVVLNNEDFLSGHVTNLIADYSYGLLLNEANIKTKVAARFDDLWVKAAGLPKAVLKEQQKIQGRTFQLSLPAAAYVGTYRHPQLGDIQLTLTDKQQPQLQWGELQTVATGYDQPDAIRLGWVPNSGEIANFKLDGKKVTSLSFNEMTFQKIN
ncbi:serine hydrolase [uncultured Rheinheimera sp.]|uniref:serine hydrolase n=1 Tax=uncultured Rheinheimera sp. TaxID=400532 RepID=UPI00259652ED|nr:serine hydrolase [uncultured Rheinheimera sp.]